MAELELRPARADDVDAIVALLASSLGWHDDPRFRDFFTWKHDANPFGASARWVACLDGRVVGFRAFLRWELERSGVRVAAVRAVDTATAADARGQGVFRSLTLHGIAALEAEGVGLVFNTPNDRSGPGYLDMGWQSVGHVRARVRPSSPAGFLHLVGGRARRGGDASTRWSEPARVGVAADEVLADVDGVEALLASRGPSALLRTAWTGAALRWRYAGAVPARAVVHPDGIAGGVAFVRVRMRSGARVAVLGDVLVPDDDPAARRALVRRTARSVDAAGLAALGPGPRLRDGFLPVAGRGPLLVARALTTAPPPTLDEWDVGYGELELF